MKLNAWNMTDGTVAIHEATCKHRKPAKSGGKGPWQQDQVEFGRDPDATDWTSKEAFAFDYWNNGILEEYEGEHGEGSFEVFQGMDFKPCCDELPTNEPEPEPEKKGKSKSKAPKEPRVIGHRAWATKAITPAMVKFTQWIAREYPELEVDPDDEDTMRLVMIASKAYGFFQSSDLNKPAEAAA